MSFKDIKVSSKYRKREIRYFDPLSLKWNHRQHITWLRNGNSTLQFLLMNAFRVKPLILHIRTWVKSDERWAEWWWIVWRTIRCICEDPSSNHGWIKKKNKVFGTVESFPPYWMKRSRLNKLRWTRSFIYLIMLLLSVCFPLDSYCSGLQVSCPNASEIIITFVFAGYNSRSVGFNASTLPNMPHLMHEHSHNSSCFFTFLSDKMRSSNNHRMLLSPTHHQWENIKWMRIVYKPNLK